MLQEDDYTEATTASELRLALDHPLRPWSEPALLSLPAASEELMAWLNDVRAFDPDFHPSAFGSAARDYERAVESRLGTKTRTVLSAELAQVKKTLHLLQPDWSGDREPARTALRALLGRLGDTDVVQASWRDLWAKVARTETSAEAIAPVRDLFLALAHRAGHDLGFGSMFTSRLQGALADSNWSVIPMRSALGDPVPEQASDYREQLLGPAGLSIAERRALCDRFVALPAEPGWHVVWLVYERASMEPMYADLGDISFFPTSYASNDAQAVTEKYRSYARNWTEADGQVLAGIPKRQGLIGVRVFLSEGVYADPVAVAQARVDALVAVGRFRAGLGADDWRLVEGHHHISGGRAGDKVLQLSAETEREHLDHVRQAAVFTELKAFWEQIGGASPADDSLAEAVELLRWWQAAQEQSPLARVIAEVRVIETAASRIRSGNWSYHLTAYLEPAWIVLAIHQYLRRTILNSIGGSFGGGEEGLDRRARERRKAVAAATHNLKDYPWISLVPGTTQTAVTELLDAYPDHHRAHRNLRTLASRMASHAAYNIWLTQLRSQWTDQLYRLERIRNAITHGGPATADAVRSISLFSGQLSAWEVQLALEAALQNTSTHAVHQRFRQDADEVLDRITGAATPGEVIHRSAVRPP